MKKFISLFLLLVTTITFATAQDITGVWQTIDDETEKPKSYVTITEIDGVYYGKVTKILNEDKVDEICDLCPGDKKDQPKLGLEIFWGLKKVKDSKYSKGSILDPNKGKTYKLSIYPEGEDKLKVRGYLGIEAAGRTQYWHRIK